MIRHCRERERVAATAQGHATTHKHTPRQLSEKLCNKRRSQKLSTNNVKLHPIETLTRTPDKRTRTCIEQANAFQCPSDTRNASNVALETHSMNGAAHRITKGPCNSRLRASSPRAKTYDECSPPGRCHRNRRHRHDKGSTFISNEADSTCSRLVFFKIRPFLRKTPSRHFCKPALF